jgi:hypothetical protein
MPATHNNLHSRVPRRAAFVLVAATLSTLCLAGAVSYPKSALERARTRYSRSEARVGEAQDLRELQRGFREAGGAVRLARAHARVDELLPRDLSPIELRGAIHALARVADLQLDVLSVSDAYPTGLAVLGDAVALREVTLVGHGSLTSLVELVEALRGLGYPTSVLEFEVSRPDVGTPVFQVRAALGLFESIPPPVEQMLQPELLQEGA